MQWRNLSDSHLKIQLKKRASKIKPIDIPSMKSVSQVNIFACRISLIFALNCNRMKKIIHVVIFALTIVIVQTGCSKKKGCTDPVSITYDSEAEKDDGTCEYGGSGGNTAIVAKPQHHGAAIISSAAYPDTAYIKYNAIDLPGINPSDYDLVIAGEDGEDHVHIPGLKRGKYFVYMTGWDTTINERVTGGTAYILTASSGEVDVLVPVVE
jgi:hypothetical protein